jgi:DNA-binding FadR family transcriptional regulator
MLLHDIDTVDHQLAVRQNLRNGAAAILVATGNDDDFVALANLVHR